MRSLAGLDLAVQTLVRMMREAPAEKAAAAVGLLYGGGPDVERAEGEVKARLTPAGRRRDYEPGALVARSVVLA